MESNFSRVIDLLPGLVWTALPDGRADFVNQRWCEYTGLSFEEACGPGWQSAVHPDDRSALLAGWQSFIASGEPGELEARLRRFDGEYRWFLFRTSPIAGASGEVVGWCGVNTEIEDRRRAQEAALAQERRSKLIVDGLPAMVTMMTPDGELEDGNRHMLDYFGQTLEVLKSRPVGYSFHPEDRPEVLARWRHSVETGEPYDHEARLRRADGVYRWFHTLGFPLRDADGAVVVWYLLQTDIDDRKWAETLLAGEKQLLSMVAQGVPLASVLEALCRVVEDAAPGRLCSVLSIDPDRVRFRHGAGPSLPAAYNEVLDGLIMDRNYGPCGMAADLKTQVIAEDVASDPRWASSPWPGVVLGHGLRSCWSTPILSRDDKVIGVFALYQTEPACPTQREHELIRQFTQIAGVAIERAQSDASLQQSEARKAAMLDSALDCIVTIDHEGRITEFNSAAERTFGYREDELLGRPMAEAIVPPALREQHRQGLARYLTTSEARLLGKRIEMTAMRADGAEFPVELTITRIPLAGPPSFTGYLRDVTERKRSEAELRRSNAYLAEAQRLSLTGSFTWKVTTDEHFWSEQVYRIFEYDTATEVSLGLILKSIHPEDIELVDEVIARANAGLDFEIDFRAVMASGAVKYIHVVAHKIRGQEGRPEYLGALQDVTERRLSEEALGRVRSELTHMSRVNSLGALTASIAHEVNQPLSGIITNASTCLRMLAADPPNVAGAQETARRTVRDGNRAADIIKRLRTLFAKRDSPSEPVDLSEAAREVIALSASDLQRSRIIVRAELAEGLPPVTGDRVQLQQVILNLLLNAADAMKDVEDRTRLLTIGAELEEDSDYVRLTVRDAGVGLDPEGAARLFDAFYTTKSEGMGIGLSVSRTIVENHGGRLWAEANDGPGATFAFSIPCSSDDPAAAPVSRPFVQSAAVDPQSVMVKR